MEKKKGIGRFLAGAVVGAGLGVLFAPKAGKETRQDLKEMFDELVRKAKDIDIDEVKDTIEAKVEEIKLELADLDKEKVLNVAKKKATDVKKKATELVDYAKEKGTPVLESLATSARDKAIDVTKEVLKKLEETK